MKILINIATHGNERIGERVVKELKKLNIDNNITFQIANEKAFKLNKRFIDQDLNRSFPGKKNGNYEQRLAYKLLPLIKSADIVLDIHSTTSNMKDCVIVTKLNKKTLECLNYIQPKTVLIMKSTKNISLISAAKIGIGFEYGKDKDIKTIKNIIEAIKRLLSYFKLIDIKPNKIKRETSYFLVDSVVNRPKGYKLAKNVKNLKMIKKGKSYAKSKNKKLFADKDFYPILFGEKNYKNIFGFAAKKINKSL